MKIRDDICRPGGNLFFRAGLFFLLVAALIRIGFGPAMAGTGDLQVLKMGIDVSGFNTTDPHFAASSSDRILADMVFNGLIRFRPGQAPDLEPDLALNVPEPEYIDGKQTWTFFLRKGVFFHDRTGFAVQELTARQVVFSFQKTMDPKRSAYAGGYDGIGIRAVDRYTVRFIVDPPQSPLLFLPKVADYAGGFIVRQDHGPTQRKDSCAEKGCPEERYLRGTGPFYLAGRDSEKFILKANFNYFRGRPGLDRVEIYFLPDLSLRLARFKHDLDLIIGECTAGWSRPIKGERGWIVDRLGVPETSNIYFNTAMKPFSDPQVRRAVAYALDRNGFRDAFGSEMVKNVFSPVPPFMPGGLTQAEVRSLGLDYPHDLGRAMSLLSQAGYAQGFTIDAVASEMGQYLTNYQTLKAQLARVNIHLNLRLADHATMHRMIRKHIYPLIIYEAFRPNTDEFLSRFFHSESIVMTGEKPATNFSHYSKIDDLIEKARSERVTLRQIKLWEYAQVKLLEDMAVYPLHVRKQIYARKTYLDYGHKAVASMALYPQITEQTRLLIRKRPGKGDRP